MQQTQNTAKKSKLNPQWIRYNNFMNEGGEGYNPFPKFLENNEKKDDERTSELLRN